MTVTREDISNYLIDVKCAVKQGRYQLSSRKKNRELSIDYVFSEEDRKNIILSLEVDDFSKTVQNEHPNYSYEVLYIFGKEVKLLPRFGGEEEFVKLYIKFNKINKMYVIIISFHKQEYPLTYMFK